MNFTGVFELKAAANKCKKKEVCPTIFAESLGDRVFYKIICLSNSTYTADALEEYKSLCDKNVWSTVPKCGWHFKSFF